MAGIVAGGKLVGGVAPGARILPLRILGWRRTHDGSYAVLGRGDALVAGLERAVDPDGNGDFRDAADIALAAVVEPFAAFSDSPESRAVAGATRLGTLVVAAAGLIVGSIFFPVGRVTTLSGATLPIWEGVGRIALCALLVALSLLGLAAISFFASTLTDVAIGAMAATLGILVLSGILDQIPQLSAIHPWLFTHDWLAFGDLLRAPIALGGITHGLLVQAGYVVVFLALAWARMTSKDVTS